MNLVLNCEPTLVDIQRSFKQGTIMAQMIGKYTRNNYAGFFWPAIVT